MSDNFPTRMTLARHRHPEVATRADEVRKDDRYLTIWGQLEQVLTDIGHLDRGMQVRILHDLLTRFTAEVQNARGRVIHALMFDHAYEEAAAMTGISRQRVYQIHHDWMERTSTPPWPMIGKMARIADRRVAEGIDQ